MKTTRLGKMSAISSGCMLFFCPSISVKISWLRGLESFSTRLRSSSANAAVAFAVATAGSGNPPDPSHHRDDFRENAKRKCSITSNVSTMRVLSVLRHWVTKHSQAMEKMCTVKITQFLRDELVCVMQDFEGNPQLKSLTIDFLEDIICTPTLLPSEHRASSQLLRMLTKDEGTHHRINLDEVLRPQVSAFNCGWT